MSVYVSPHHHTNMKSIFTQQFSGSSFVSPALGVEGQGRLNIKDRFPPKKIWVKPKQAGKKKGGLGEGIFARLTALRSKAKNIKNWHQDFREKRFGFRPAAPAKKLLSN